MPNNKRLFLFLFLGAVLLFVQFYALHHGSIPNSDDAIYGEIMRNVSQGFLFPLNYADNPYTAKPPLYFWGGGLFLHLFGVSEWTLRAPIALFSSLILFLILSILHRYSFRSALLGTIFLLSLDQWVDLSRRPMLEVPVLFLGFLMFWLFLHFRRTTKNAVLIALLGGLGWWIKEWAILPFLASLLFVSSFDRKHRFSLQGYVSLISTFSIFPISYFFLGKSLNSSSISQSWPAIEKAAISVPFHETVYLDLLFSESWILRLSLLFLPWMAWRIYRKREQGVSLLFFFLIIFQSLALFLTETKLPHYFFPVSVFLVLLFSIQLVNLIPKSFHMILFFLGILAAVTSHLDIFRRPSPVLEQGSETKVLALKASSLLPKDHVLCVFDTYPPGFQFYSSRKTMAFLTTDQAFRAMNAVREFRGLIHRTEPNRAMSILQEQCRGIGIVPIQWYPEFVPSKDRTEFLGNRFRLIQLR